LSNSRYPPPILSMVSRKLDRRCILDKGMSWKYLASHWESCSLQLTGDLDLSLGGNLTGELSVYTLIAEDWKARLDRRDCGNDCEGHVASWWLPNDAGKLVMAQQLTQYRPKATLLRGRCGLMLHSLIQKLEIFAWRSKIALTSESRSDPFR